MSKYFLLLLFLKNAAAPWYLYVNSELNPNLINTEIHSIQFKNSKPNDNYTKENAKLQSDLKKIDKEQLKCCNYAMSDNADCESKVWFLCITVFTGGIGGLVYGCLNWCVWKPNEKKLEENWQNIRNKQEILKKKYAIDRKWMGFSKCKEIFKGLYIMEDLDNCDDNYKYDSIEIEIREPDYIKKRDFSSKYIKLNIEFANLNSQSKIREIYSGTSLNFAIWGEDLTEYTKKIVDSIKHLVSYNPLCEESVPSRGTEKESNLLERAATYSAKEMTTGLTKKLLEI